MSRCLWGPGGRGLREPHTAPTPSARAPQRAPQQLLTYPLLGGPSKWASCCKDAAQSRPPGQGPPRGSPALPAAPGRNGCPGWGRGARGPVDEALVGQGLGVPALPQAGAMPVRPWAFGLGPAPSSALVSGLGKEKTGLLFPETRAPACPRPGLYTGPFVCPLARGAWPHGAAYPGRVHQQL